MRKLLAPFHFTQKLILRVFIYLFLPKHKFKKGDLVYKDGTRTLYEVDDNYFNSDLFPITIVRPYPVGKQVFGIDRYDILEFVEHRKPLRAGYNSKESDVGISAHENEQFGKRGKK